MRQVILFIFLFSGFFVVGSVVEKKSHINKGASISPRVSLYTKSKGGKLKFSKRVKLSEKREKGVIGWIYNKSVLVGSSDQFTLIVDFDYAGNLTPTPYWQNLTWSGSSDFQIVSNNCVGNYFYCQVEMSFSPSSTNPAGVISGDLVFTLYIPAGPGYSAETHVFYANLNGLPYEVIMPEEPCTECGSIIREEDRSFSESVPIVGTGISMYYSSNHAVDFVSSYTKPNRVSSFNPEGWTASIVHRYDQANNLLFLGTGGYQQRTSLPAGGTNVMVVSNDEVYVFDSSGKHLQTKSLLTGFVKYYFTYSGSSKLTKITDALGLEINFGRNGSGVLQTITSPYSQVTNVSVNGSGMISEIENPNSESHEFTYLSSSELMSTFKKPGGETSTFTYRQSGELESDSGAGGNSWSYENFANGTSKDTTKTSAAGHVTNMTTSKDSGSGEYYRTITTPAGFTTNYLELPNSGSEFGSDFHSVITDKTTDERFGSALNRVSQISENTIEGSRVTEYLQTATLSTPSDPFSYTQIVKTKRVNGVDTVSTFVKSTKTETIVDPMGVQTVKVLDSYERPVSIQLGSDTATTVTYDVLGRLSQITQGGQNTFDYTYDANGNLQKIENALGQETTYTYDNAGRRTTTTLPDSRVISYQYNSNGQLTGITPPSRPQHSFISNLMGFISSYTSPTVSGVTSSTTTYDYNSEKKISEIIRPDTRGIYYTYGSTTGLLNSINYDWGTESYTYESNTERPQSILTADSVQSDFEYFGLDRIASETQTRGSDTTKVKFTRDNFFRITNRELFIDSASVGNIASTYRDDNQPSQIGQMTLSYNSTSGRLTSTTLDRIDDTRTYDTYGNLATYTATYTPVSGPVQTLYSYSLTRDTLHRITAKTETIQGVTTTYGYTYDSAGRLSTVTKNSAAHSNYTYDNNSNRTSGSVGGVSFTATYDNQDRMLTYNSNTYSYNDNGDLVSMVDGSSATTSFVSDAFGRLKQVTLPSTTAIDYKLDWMGRRVATEVNSSLTNRAIYQDSLRLSGELNPSTSVFKEYIYGTNINSADYIKIISNKYRIIKDHLGSPRLVVKSTDGTVLQRMDYNEWGKVTADSNPGAQPFGFAGGLYDPNTKLVHFGARDYDPETGRWTSKDPILFEGGDTNLYGYVLQDPLNFKDVNGFEIRRCELQAIEVDKKRKEISKIISRRIKAGLLGERGKALCDDLEYEWQILSDELKDLEEDLLSCNLDK